jgi:hypothetical protein
VNHTHSLAEWFAFLLLGVGVHGSYSVPYFLFVDANLADFDPRPLALRAADRLLVEIVNAKATARDAALSAAALLMLLTAPQKGALR